MSESEQYSRNILMDFIELQPLDIEICDVMENRHQVLYSRKNRNWQLPLSLIQLVLRL